MKKVILLVSLVSILLIGGLAIAKDQPEGEPFQAIWDAIFGLTDRVSQIEERVAQLEGRVCSPGSIEVCDTGLLGVCAAGKKVCSQEGTWGLCVQNEQPSSEIRDGLDNDCDGEVDEELSVLQDNFNAYTNGSIVGQGGWIDYVNGQNFIVQEGITFEGIKALYNNTHADSVIYKTGVSLANGGQTFYVRSDNRPSWEGYPDPAGYLNVRVLKGHWNSSFFLAVGFRKDGSVAYYDGSNYQNFATYNDNEWTKLDVEWRSSDDKARYRINDETWTDWDIFADNSSFIDFDSVGLDFKLPSGSGGIYIDNLY